MRYAFTLILGLMTTLALGQDVERLQQQEIVVNARNVHGVFYYTPEGQLEVVRCKKPTRWVSPDPGHKSSGWACFEPNTNIWVLNAVPPSTNNAQGEIQSRPGPDLGDGQGKEPQKSTPASSQKPRVENSPRELGTPKVSNSKPLPAPVRVGAGGVDEVEQKVDVYKRGGLGAAIPCHTEKDKVIPSIITNTCGGIVGVGR